MADAEQHPLVAQLEHVGAGDVLVLLDPDRRRHVIVQQEAQMQPLFQVRRFHQVWRIAAGCPIIGVAFQPAVGIPLTRLRLLPGGLPEIDGNRLGPLFQLVVQSESDLDPAGALAVIDNGRLAILGNETRAAVHAVAGRPWGERGRVPRPVHQIRAGDMGEGTTLRAVVVNVLQMIPAFPVEGAIRIAGEGGPGTGMSQMIGQPVHRRIRRLGRRFDRIYNLLCGGDQFSVLLENQAALSDLCSTLQVINRKAPIRSVSLPFSKAHQAQGLISDSLLGSSFLISSPGHRSWRPQSNRAGSGRPRPFMPQPKDSHVVLAAQQIDVAGFVGGIGLAVVIDGYLMAFIGDCHLDR